MLTLAQLRGRYGGQVFVTYLPDGTQIPWRPLSLGEFLQFQTLLNTDQYPKAVIEDELFCKCVLDVGISSSLDQLKAGTVSVVVATIMAFSGPENANELNHALAFQRQIAGQVIHQMATLIASVFPAYKLEDVYNLDYDTFMLRIAQAESRLLTSGAIKEPISFSDPSTEVNDSTPKPNLKELYDKVYEPKTKPISKPVTSSPGQTIVSAADIAEGQAFAYTGHESEDRILLEHEMIKSAAAIYPDYYEKVKKGEKIQVKTVEERLVEAKERQEESQKIYQQQIRERNQKEKEKESLKSLAAKKKKHKASRR